MFKGIFKILISYFLILFSLVLSISLIKFSPNDLSFYTTAFHPTYVNVLGALGVYIATPFVFFYGQAAWIWALFSLIIGMRILLGITPKALLTRLGIAYYFAILWAALASLLSGNFSFINGGIFGSLIAETLTSILPNFIWIPIMLGFFAFGIGNIVPYKKLIQYINSLRKTPQLASNTIAIEALEEYPLKEESHDDNDNSTLLSTSSKAPTYYGQEEDKHYGSVDSLMDDVYQKLEKTNFKYHDQVPSFLQEIIEEEIDNPERQDPIFMSKKPLPLKKKEEDSLLRDVDIDLLSPYLRGSNAFYEKIEENQQKQEQISSPLVEDMKNIAEGLDDLDQSPQPMLPVSEWVRESGVSLTDFIRKSPNSNRLSFSAGIIKDDSIDQEQFTEPIDNTFLVTPTNTESGIDGENIKVLPEDSEEKIGSSVSSESMGEVEEVDIPQHISNFPPVSTLTYDEPLILQDFDESTVSYFSLEDVQEQIPNTPIDITPISDSEKMLLQGIERTIAKQQVAADSFKEKIYKKQQELAKQHYQTHPNTEEKEPLSVLTAFSLQDFEKEIVALKNASGLTNPVVDETFLATHQSILAEEENGVVEILDNQPSIHHENFSDKSSEELIEELMMPIVDENIDQNNDTLVKDELKESLDSDTQFDKNIVKAQESEYPKEDIHDEVIDHIDEEYDTPQFASLMRLDLGEVTFPDISALTESTSTADTSLESTIQKEPVVSEQREDDDTLLYFDKIIGTSQNDDLKFSTEDNKDTQQLLAQNNVQELLQHTEKGFSFQENILTNKEEDTPIEHEIVILPKIPSEQEVNTVSDDRSEDQTITIDNTEENDDSEYSIKSSPKKREESLISVSSGFGTEPEFIISEHTLEKEIAHQQDISQEVQEVFNDPIGMTAEKSDTITRELPILQHEKLQYEELVNQVIIPISTENDDSEETSEDNVFGEAVQTDNFSIEESPINNEYQQENMQIENNFLDEIFIPEISNLSREEDTPIVSEKFIDRDFILDTDKNLFLDNTEEIKEALDNDNNINKDITDLDTPEALLMPSVTTESHLIVPMEYPIVAQEEQPVLDTEVEAIAEKQKPIFPSIEDLEPNTDTISKAEEDEEIEMTMKMIEDTYESFNINMQVVDYSRGPTITRFELEPPSGLKLRTIFNLQDDLALQAGTSNLRIISPVEGRSLIGIEVPNKVRRNFLLREQIESDVFQETEAALPLILGVDVGGKEIVGDLATTPHLLIAGTTGSGKSVYVNALIMGLLFKLPAEDLKFIMIDPKMVELELYNGIPHLLAPIITKPEEAMAALEWAVQEMDRRYKILSESSVRNIKEYQNLGKNSPTGNQGYEKLPYIVIIVDEFANLMLRSPKDTEKHISRLASMSRAIGIHLVLATQRPSVDVVTGVIKANFPSRIAFRVSSKIDSRTIIDRNGAETLLGKGDMLFMSPDYMDPIRIQSPYASNEDVARAVNTIKKNGPPNYAIDFSEVLAKQDENNSDGSRTDAVNDPLFAEVLNYAVDNGEISASGIQRRFRVGYNRASRLIESMKDMKIISPPPSAGKGWSINITRDEINKYLD